MERRKHKEQKINEIPSSDKETLKYLIESLEDLVKEDAITEQSVSRLTMITSDLCRIKDSQAELLIRWLKQGFYLDQ
jgi:hypothetical protein